MAFFYYYSTKTQPPFFTPSYYQSLHLNLSTTQDFNPPHRYPHPPSHNFYFSTCPPRGHRFTTGVLRERLQRIFWRASLIWAYVGKYLPDRNHARSASAHRNQDASKKRATPGSSAPGRTPKGGYNTRAQDEGGQARCSAPVGAGLNTLQHPQPPPNPSKADLGFHSRKYP